MITLAMDGGQSGIRARIVETGAEVELPAVQTSRAVTPQLAAAAVAATPDGADTVLVGTTGLGPGDSAASLLELLRPHGVRTVAVAHDSVTSYLGALGDWPGCVVAAGTGVVTLGVGADRIARVDGWGYLIGDAGSGYAIGRAAFDAVMRAYDGRGPATALTEVIRADFPDLEATYLILQSDPDKVRRIASYARAVADLGDSDPVATSILGAAADDLARSVATAVRHAGLPSPAAVCRLGNVFKGRVLNEAFVAALRTELPGALLVDPQGTSLDGAALLASLSGATAIGGRVDLARA